MYDPDLYRTKEEIDAWKRRDPIATLIGELQRLELLTDDDVAAIESDVAAEVEDAVAFAEAGTLEPVEQLTRFVISEAP